MPASISYGTLFCKILIFSLWKLSDTRMELFLQNMTSPSLLFTVFFILVSACFVFPSNEFVSAGFTVQNLFGSLLGSEHENFVLYQIRRTALTVFVHALLPSVYLLGLGVIDPTSLFGNTSHLWNIFVYSSVLVPLVTSLILFYWWRDNWSKHPIVKNLNAYSSTGQTWCNIATDINVEFRRIDKFCLDTSSMVKIIATDNWVVKVSPYNVKFAHQNDTALILISSDTHHMTPRGHGTVQYINIEVKPTRNGALPFIIRLDALDFRDLQDKVRCPITVLENVTFHRTVTDRFLEAFKEQIAENPFYTTDVELEPCIGCMQTTANVKLRRTCETPISGEEPCTDCQCRPMWCVDCMGKWFASRQDPARTDSWLSKKCTCPLCRSRFCILDVCLIQPRES